MNKIYHWLILTIILLSYYCSMGQHEFRFKLISVQSDRHFFNFEYNKNQLFLGTDSGILLFSDSGILHSYSKEKKGYVYYENNSLKTSNTFKGAIATPHYNYLLPPEFRNTSIIGTNFKNFILIISGGQLFIYKKEIRAYLDTISIRSISKNFVGTYSGIFYKKKLIPYPKYTSGYIREFPGETFICFDGLERINSNGTTVFESSLGSALILKKDIGRIRDIFRDNNYNYLLFSEKGLYLSDLKTFIKQINATQNNVEPKFLKADYRDGEPIIVYFISGNSILRYDILTQRTTKLLSIDPKYGNIMDAIIGTPHIYLVTQNQLIKCTSNVNSSDFSIEILKSGLTGNHHIIESNNILLIPANDGLHSYNVDTRKWISNLIKDEFNSRAVYINNQNIFLGTLHGYYELNQQLINDLIADRIEEIETEIENETTNKVIDKSIIITLLSILSTLLLGLCIYFKLRYKSNFNEKRVVKPNEIHDYIDQNIKTVTIENISSHFKITPVQLYEILGKHKPGEIIKEKRLEIIKKMRKDNRKEEDISFVTGFSLSYLKKIKT